MPVAVTAPAAVGDRPGIPSWLFARRLRPSRVGATRWHASSKRSEVMEDRPQVNVTNDRGIEYIQRALSMADQLRLLADDGETNCSDDGCAVLYGVIRDCAYRIKSRAEAEGEWHRLYRGRR